MYANWRCALHITVNSVFGKVNDLPQAHMQTQKYVYVHTYMSK